MNKGDT